MRDLLDKRLVEEKPSQDRFSGKTYPLCFHVMDLSPRTAPFSDYFCLILRVVLKDGFQCLTESSYFIQFPFKLFFVQDRLKQNVAEGQMYATGDKRPKAKMHDGPIVRNHGRGGGGGGEMERGGPILMSFFFFFLSRFMA